MIFFSEAAIFWCNIMDEREKRDVISVAGLYILQGCLLKVATLNDE